ncbi:hypothetical protein VPK24_10555 [Limnothrix redekei LRLZ20PSL1]|uniref:Uncharacterized protein n=1 Tax=Limnothrix redekei LRLZ20PSL1 TaxID=3112953 RepID=A0ABW7CAL8_9CYAN
MAKLGPDQVGEPSDCSNPDRAIGFVVGQAILPIACISRLY